MFVNSAEDTKILCVLLYLVLLYLFEVLIKKLWFISVYKYLLDFENKAK